MFYVPGAHRASGYKREGADGRPAESEHEMAHAKPTTKAQTRVSAETEPFELSCNAAETNTCCERCNTRETPWVAALPVLNREKLMTYGLSGDLHGSSHQVGSLAATLSDCTLAALA